MPLPPLICRIRDKHRDILLRALGKSEDNNGFFTAGYGIFWFLGSALIGILFGVSLPALIAFSLVAELAAIPLFVVVSRRSAQ